MSNMDSPGPSARERSRRRKWIYGVSMIVLIVVLFWLSRPATLGTNEVKPQPGGVLAQYRDQHRLSQTELGQIDPTSETIRLATLGMRGVAGTTLWWKATQFQMKKDWTRLRATLDQISKLQPHSILVWRYQAWNLSYNVSVAFDDYHDKFYWVIEGLNYMLDGVRANDREPRLYWDMGWFISNKIGRADDAKYFRRLFRGERGPDGKDPPDYVKAFRENFTPPTGFPPSCWDLSDNWHVGKAWFLAAESKIAPPRYPVRGMATVIFYSDAPTCQFYYADNQEKDGVFGQKARRVWQDAEREWHDFGERPIETSYDDPLTGGKLLLQLNRREELFDQAEEKKDQLDGLAPGARDKLEEEKRVALAPEARTAWDLYRQELDKYKRDKKQWKSGKIEKAPLQPSVDIDLRDRAEAKPDEIARRCPPPPARQQTAKDLAHEIEHLEELARNTNRERMKVNFDFWRTRARAEQREDCVDARKSIHSGDQAFAKGDLIRARPAYEKGLLGWCKVLNEPEFHPLLDDISLGGDLIDVIRRYQRCLAQDDRDLPDPFILPEMFGMNLPDPLVLQEIVDKHGQRQGSPLPPVINKKAKPNPSTTENPDKKDKPPASTEDPDKKPKPSATNGSKRP